MDLSLDLPLPTGEIFHLMIRLDHQARLTIGIKELWDPSSEKRSLDEQALRLPNIRPIPIFSHNLTFPGSSSIFSTTSKP